MAWALAAFADFAAGCIKSCASCALRYKHIYTYVDTYIHTYVHTYIHTCIHAYIHTYIHTYTHTWVHASIHTNKHAFIHLHAHTHIYICIYGKCLGFAQTRNDDRRRIIIIIRIKPLLKIFNECRSVRGGGEVNPYWRSSMNVEV